MMEMIQDQTFKDAIIDPDGKFYLRCIFDNCRFVRPTEEDSGFYNLCVFTNGCRNDDGQYFGLQSL